MRSTDRKVNILLVDDRPEGLLALEAVLENPRYNLVTAGSGEEALARVLDYDFAVILMDVQMPGMDGFETVNLIKQRERSKNVPVIFLTAISKELHFVQRGYETGAVDYLFKPFDSTVLISKVAVFADLYLKNQQIREQSEMLRQSEVRERARQLALLQMESLNRYRHLADAIPHIIWKFQPEGTLDYCNRLWMDFSGMNLEKSSGHGWQAGVHPDDLAYLMRMFNDARKTNAGFELECRLLRNLDGQFRYHMIRGTPEMLSGVQAGAWIVTATDIEDRKRIEQDLIKAKEDSLAANEAKSAFLANMSHEIRTPLGIVLGFAELLANSDISLDERRNGLVTVRKNGELLSGLIGDILDLSKIEAGHFPIDISPFALPEFLQNAIQSFQHQANEKGIQFKVTLESPIPVAIQSDPMRLRQILFNLVGNALKFTIQGQIMVSVRMDSLDEGQETLRISVTDQGLGISPEQAGRLFQPFIQADSSTTRRFGGTGLGLSLSRKLAKLLGGDVQLTHSELNKGSTFTITIGTGSLKGVGLTHELPAIAKPVVSAPVSDQRLRGISVLVVEDSFENQILVSHFLKKAGAEVALADNGQIGVDKALAGSFDLVLMDIQMPVLDGYQAARLLRSHGYKKPILALTAHALKEERDKCIAAGCNDHLTKPVNREELLKRVALFAGRGVLPTTEIQA